MRHRHRPRLAARAGNALLTLAAVGGALCVVAVLAAAFFQISLILFKTGSMAPTIPAGSVALVRQIPAEQARVGDVVTVDRPGQLPITHRVVATAPAGNGETALTLRGDANRQDDAQPYRVTQVRLVLVALPGVAPVIVLASNPIVLGATTVVTALLVGWAFWPRERERTGRPRRTPNHRATTGAGAGVLVAVLALAGVVTAPLPARAAPTETVHSGQYLTLTSIADPAAFAALAVDIPVRWIVGVSAHPPEAAPITFGLSATGPLTEPDGLSVSVSSCTARWSGSVCPGHLSHLLTPQPLATLLSGMSTDGVRPVGTMSSTEQRWLAIDVTLLANPEAPDSTRLSVHAWGPGDTVQTAGPPAALASTGIGFPRLGVLLAGGAVAAGGVTAGLAHRRRRKVAP